MIKFHFSIDVTRIIEFIMGADNIGAMAITTNGTVKQADPTNRLHN